tara:strand:- start:58 stop:504 length:447 start_codon:yes stop_codon:yes gene_type:complete
MKKKILIVNANYYKKISLNLNKGAIKILNKYKFDYDIISVPGAFEIPLTIKNFINKKKYVAYIALGCIIKGETYHFNLISNECSRSINNLSLKYNIPIGFGVLSCNNMKQAEKRSRLDKNNKGGEAANACIHMIKILSSNNHTYWQKK